MRFLRRAQSSVWKVCFLILTSLLLHVGAQAKVELRFVVWDGDEALGILRAETQAFERAHPDIAVRLENVDYKIFFQKLLTQYAANTAPDVAMLDPQNFQQFAKRGALLKIGSFIANTPGFNLGDYYKPIVNALTWRRDLYALPRDIAPIGLIYYNKRLFKEAGLDPPDGSWTWSERPRPELGSKCFTYCMQRLTKLDPNGQVARWGFAASWAGAFTDTVAFSSGVRYVNDPEAFTKLNFDDPKVINAFQFVADLQLKQHWMPSQSELASSVQSTALDLFISQRAAMYQCGIWDVPHIRAGLKPGSKDFFDWDITMAPGHIDPATGHVIRAFPTGGSGYGIFSSTSHPREAWQLVQWMAGEHAMKAMARAGIAQPAIRKIALGPDWIPGKNTPLEERYPANRIVTDRAIPYVVFPPTADYWTEVSSLVFAKTDSIYTGATTAKSALEEGNRIGTSRLDAILSKKDLPDYNWKVGVAFGGLLVMAICFWIYYPERKRKLSLAQKRESRTGYVFLLPWIIGAIGFTAGPVILSLLMSLSDWDIIMRAKWIGMHNYHEAFFDDPRFWNSAKVTGLFTVVAVPVGIIIALALAILLNQKVRGMAIFRTFFYLPSLVSIVASSLLWMKIFQPNGGLLNLLLFGSSGVGGLFGLGQKLGTNGQPPNWLGDERLALPSLMIMSMWGVGAAMIILLAALQGIPEFYYEAAKLDGASAWQRFRAVTLPLVSPALFFTLITGVIGSLQTFTQAFVMTQGGPNDSTRFLMLHIYDQGFGNLRMGYASSLAWIMFIAILGVTVIQFRLNKLVHYGSEQ